VPFYEILFETGSKSVIFAESDEEAARGLAEQHTRAKSGLPGGPGGHPAERISNVLVYDRHPADYGQEQSFSKDVALKTVTELINDLADENGVVAKHALTQAIHETSNALVPRDEQDRLSSQYKMKEKRSLDSSLWEGGK
jgi:hypothetical protein